MNILGYGSRILTRTSPLGLIIGGAAIALAIPTVRKGLRAGAVLAVRGVLSVSEEAKRISTKSRHTMQSMMAEAQGDDCCASCEEFSKSVHPRRVAIAAAAGMMAASNKAKDLFNNASLGVKNFIDEAKTLSNDKDSNEDPNDGLEGDFVELPKH
ncbi:hypothetical protein [Dendrosporobacter sp. 1207_IL3150]|uniref:hypothetical protein n=1 Tax=Dendrosporobacter sp. 1207_IL3150 TaxID=3084054 RepID=UPI002FD9EFF0